jgi:hypothetical protein
MLVGFVKQVSVDLGLRRTARLIGRSRFTPGAATGRKRLLRSANRSADEIQDGRSAIGRTGPDLTGGVAAYIGKLVPCLRC